MQGATALLVCHQMREADRLTVASGTPAVDLMDNAGSAVAREIQRRWSMRPVAVLCGPGDNGGDGFVVARLLHDAGWPVRLALLGAREAVGGSARHHADRWPGAIEAMAPAVLDGAGLVVDAIFGAGLNRPLTDAVRETLDAATKRRRPLVAVDVPSGVNGDTGETFGAAQAALTVTFFRKKPGHLLLPGRTLCGEIVTADIGIAASVLEQIKPTVFENDPVLWLSQLPSRLQHSNKFTHGHALIIGGYPMTGAARLAARSAARAGAGLTTVAVPQIAFPIYAAALASTMVQPLANVGDLARLLEDPRFNALLIGPGAIADAATRQNVGTLLATGRPVVLDAGALTAFKDEPELLDRAIVGPCVLTPHEGEFRRLFDHSGDKLARGRAAARRCKAIVVLKGADTVVAAPDGTTIINANAPASLATAGSGDVLAGIIVGLLAQGMAPFSAAAAGVWLHGAAANEFGPGLIADDLADLLPQVWRRLATLGQNETSTTAPAPDH